MKKYQDQACFSSIGSFNKIRFALVFIVLLPLSLFSQHHIYVDDNNAGGLQNGMSWSTAFADLQLAIDNTQPGDTLWVAEGIYKPTDTDDRTISFVLSDSVVMLGGFEGTETTAVQRNFALHPTVLSGDIGSPGVRNDNSYHVLRGKKLSAATELDGLVIRDGYSYYESPLVPLDAFGAGLLLEGASGLADSRPLIKNCRFEQNAANNGGAIACYWKTSGSNDVNPKIVNCIFESNRASLYGGALYKYGSAGQDTFYIKNCQFLENYSILDGGAICIYSPIKSVYTFLINCLFEKDSTSVSGSGAAISLQTPLHPVEMIGNITFDSCIIRHCYGTSGSVVGYETTAFETFKNQLFIKNSIVEENGPGAAVEMYMDHLGKADIRFYRSTFSNNKAGALYFRTFHVGNEVNFSAESCKFISNWLSINISGWQNNPGTAKMDIQNSFFINNKSTIGLGTTQFDKAETLLTNCTFVKQSDWMISKSWWEEFATTGGYNNCKVRNCILYNMDTTKLGIKNGLLDHLYGFDLAHNLFSVPAPPNVPGSQEAFGAGNIFGIDPMFKDTLAGDYSLLSCSPAMDAGDNNAAPLSAFDLAGNPRIRFGTIDLGAYEQQDSCGMSAAPTAPDIVSKTLLIWPNPSGSVGVLHFQGPAFGEAELRVLDVAGNQQVVRPVLLSDNNAVDLSALDAGVYFVELICGRELYVAKWVRFK